MVLQLGLVLILWLKFATENATKMLSSRRSFRRRNKQNKKTSEEDGKDDGRSDIVIVAENAWDLGAGTVGDGGAVVRW